MQQQNGSVSEHGHNVAEADYSQPAGLLETLLATFRPAGFYSSSGQTTTHKTRKDVDQRQILWAVRTLKTGAIEVNPLFNGLPAPASMKLDKKVPREKFLQHFWPEPDLYVRDAMQLFGKTDNAEEYPASLKATVKAYLPLILAYLATGQREKAKTIIDFMAENSVPMCAKQKKLLNKIAQELRKAEHHETAMQVYATIRKHYGDDAALHFNIARTFYELRKPDKCEAHLVHCLKLDPKLEVARRFLAQLRKVRASAKA